MGDKIKTWMPMYWADYFANTLDFSTLEHGAYLCLIGYYWTSGGPIRNDPVALMRVTRLSGHEGEVALHRVLSKFTLDGEFWTHDRIDAELTSARVRKSVATERSKKGVAARLCVDEKSTRLVNSKSTSSPSQIEEQHPKQIDLGFSSPSQEQLGSSSGIRAREDGKREYAPGVLLTEAQFAKLGTDWEPGEREYWLTELSDAAAKNPAKWARDYKDHYRVAHQWRRRRQEDGKVWNVAQKLYLRPTAIYTRAVSAKPSPDDVQKKNFEMLARLKREEAAKQ